MRLRFSSSVLLASFVFDTDANTEPFQLEWDMNSSSDLMFHGKLYSLLLAATTSPDHMTAICILAQEVSKIPGSSRVPSAIAAEMATLQERPAFTTGPTLQQLWLEPQL